MSLKELVNQMPENYYVCQKMLWCGDIGVEIDHRLSPEDRRSLDQPLDYELAFKKMLVKLESEK